MVSRHLSTLRSALKGEGFTLIELLVVILVIAVLMAVAAPSFLGQTKKAEQSTAKQYLTIAYRTAKADTVSREGAWGTAAPLASAINTSEPTLHVVPAIVAPSSPKTGGKQNISLSLPGGGGGTLTLITITNSGDVCTLTVPVNGTVSTSCEGGGGGAALPSNDDFENAMSLSGSDGDATVVDNTLATLQVDEPQPDAGGVVNTLWYVWTYRPPATTFSKPKVPLTPILHL